MSAPMTDFDVLDPQLRALERTHVYCVEGAALALDRSIGISDERATQLASDIVGEPVRLIKASRPGLERHIVAYWYRSEQVCLPVILANPGYTLSRTEVLHESAHLLCDGDGILRGHGAKWRSTFLGLLTASEAARVASGYDFYGLSY